MKKVIIIVISLIVIVGGFLLFNSLSGKPKESAPLVEDFNEKGFKLTQGSNQVSGTYVDPSTIDFGVNIYPNSIPAAGDQKPAGSFNLNGVKLTAATYQTSDERTKVENFYKNQFGSDAISSSLVDTGATYKVIKSKTNTGSTVNVWVENGTTYFTILKPN